MSYKKEVIKRFREASKNEDVGSEQYKELMLVLYPEEEFVDLDYVPEEDLA